MCKRCLVHIRGGISYIWDRALYRIYPDKFDWGWSFHVLSFQIPEINLSQMVESIVPTCLSADGASRQPQKILTKKDIDTPHYDQQIGIRPTKRMKVIDRWEGHEQNTIRGMSGEALQARLLCVDCMPSFFLANRHNILIILQIFLLRLRSPHSCFFCFNPHYCCQRN